MLKIFGSIYRGLHPKKKKLTQVQKAIINSRLNFFAITTKYGNKKKLKKLAKPFSTKLLEYQMGLQKQRRLNQYMQ